MLNHLRPKHSSVNKLLTPTKEKQIAVTAFFNSPSKLSSNQSEKITQAIANMIVTDYVSPEYCRRQRLMEILGAHSMQKDHACPDT